MSSTASKIKERLSIEDVVEPYVKLTRAGANLKGRCPFHNEKTPSFFVSPDRGTYYCFGCGAKGDIFSFVQQIDGLDFVGALKLLGERAGVPVVFENPAVKDEREKLFEAMEEAAKFYEENLVQNSEAKDYLLKRGLTEKTISDFRLGYALNDWHTLEHELAGRKFSEEILLRAGLVKKSEGRVYDTFRDRIAFPICDASSRVVAFSGRILHDDGKSAKYLNSPETPLFTKSKIFFGFDKAKQQIRTLNYSILVEGQMDLLMSHQAGFINTVASSGTALSEEQLVLLNRLSSRIIMAFDADGAGYKAALRSTQLALERGFEVKVANLPADEDPASLILKDKEAWKKVIKESTDVIDFALKRAIEKGGRDKVKAVRQEVLPYVAFLESAIEKSQAVAKVARALGVKEEAVWEDLGKVRHQEERQIEKEEVAEGPKVTRKNYIGKRLIAILYWQRLAATPLISVAEMEQKFKEILGVEKFAEVDKFYEKKATELSFEAEVAYADANKLDREVAELFSEFYKENLRSELSAAMVELREAEVLGDKAKAEKILKQCHEISLKLKT
ncbi:MAG: DNA primase [Candidatus Paceibacterota bacterium]|jgi:DNA primase